MHPPILIFLLALLTAPASADAGLDTQAQTELVAAHNHWRAEVGVGPVRWAADLGAAAQHWAEHLAQNKACQMQHASRDLLGNTGENLHWASPVQWSDGRREAQTVAPRQVVDDWGSEQADYDAQSHRCTPGKVCGHYTQMVWKDSREIGCAKAQCADFSQVWVCRYRPAGNVVGQTPH